MMRSVLSSARRSLSTTSSSSASAVAPKKVAVTGAAGAIGYALLMRIASGQLLGPNQPVDLSLIEIESGLKPLRGVSMEVLDGAFPLVQSVCQTASLETGFGDADVAILVGARPRGPGMERNDLMSANAAIFAEQGKAINDHARSDIQVLVVGNPANTNALVAASNAPDIDPRQFMAMTRLDQNRALAQLSNKLCVPVREIQNVVIWGNHSSTQFPDVSNAVHVPTGKRVSDLLASATEHEWIAQKFIPRVQKRGAEIIGARGASSAASAASAAIDTITDLNIGRSDGAWQSIAVPSDGSYGIDKDIWYSVPVTCPGKGVYERVLDVPSPDEFAAAMMDATRKELLEERDAVRHLLPGGDAKPAAKSTRKRKTKKAASA